MADPEKLRAPDLVLPNEDTFIDWAVDQVRKKDRESSFIQPLDKTLLVVGSRGVGKSTFIVKTFELEEEVKPTLGMEYYFTLNSELDDKNELCNIWELGGGTIFSSTLFAIENMPNATAVIVMDLGNPSTLSESFTSLRNVLLNYISKTGDVSQMVSQAKAAIRNHQDVDFVEPFPVPLVIVATKFDKFQSFEPEQRRVISKYLRFLAHSNQATLLYFSSKIPSLIRTAKEVFRHYTHGFDKVTNVQTDHNKPLIIPAGSDKFESIYDGLENISSTKEFEALLNSHFKQEAPKEKKFDITPLLATAKEKHIDDLLLMKEEELALLDVEGDLKNHLMNSQHLSSAKEEFLFDARF